MCFLLFFVVCYIVLWVCMQYGMELPSSDFLIVLAILSVGEIISWRVEK